MSNLASIPTNLLRLPVQSVALAPASDDDPSVSVRYDKSLNMIALSVDGTDDVYFDRDSGFSLMDQIARVLEVQAKLGGAS
ncbi:hypothetical protein [Rhodococcus globerulus]|uniref:hypothetical protein n=1 Tax=Rhodococcus globerulus TaxID=33008 RepID=UPI001C58D54F|nr:hypothetical protein [Rhodococcus globerulus]QXW04048.1 hypothetical protein KYT97_08515 [Rhodococcus globerulus]